MSNYIDDLTVNVMMVGGRRAGKTSVLAAMQNCFEEVLKDNPLLITPSDYDMIEIIEKKQQELKQYFLSRGKKKDFVPSQSGTGGVVKYPFDVKLKGKSSKIRINFVDYPGEWLSKKEHVNELESYMKESRILLVTIDTPCLMELKGAYNDPMNLCYRVTQMVKNTGFANGHKGPGMILFVPLKCERYYNDGRMGEVNTKVQEAYKPLLQYIQKPDDPTGKPPKITTAVTPILTMGGAEFSRFDCDDNGDIILDETWGAPIFPRYHFPDMSKDSPEPRYCEQPLLFILSFVFAEAERARKAQKVGVPWLDMILDIFRYNVQNWASSSDYLKQASTIYGKIRRSGDGYSILNRGILKG